MALLAALALVLCGLAALKSLVGRRRLERSFAEFTRASPTLVIKRVGFSKYLARGSLPGADPHFANLDVFLIRGTADIQYDLSQFRVNRKRTNYFTRTLALEYAGKERLLVDADIHVEPDGITLVESIDPVEFTKAELDSASAFAAAPAGIAGALIGGTAGSAASGAIPFMKYSGGLGSVLGGAAGALAGGAAGAGSAWLFTDKLLTSLQQGRTRELSMMELIASAKPLIGMELVCGEALDGPDWEREVERRYREEFAARMTELAPAFGWRRVVLDMGAVE